METLKTFLSVYLVFFALVTDASTCLQQLFNSNLISCFDYFITGIEEKLVKMQAYFGEHFGLKVTQYLT